MPPGCSASRRDCTRFPPSAPNGRVSKLRLYRRSSVFEILRQLREPRSKRQDRCRRRDVRDTACTCYRSADMTTGPRHEAFALAICWRGTKLHVRRYEAAFMARSCSSGTRGARHEGALELTSSSAETLLEAGLDSEFLPAANPEWALRWAVREHRAADLEPAEALGLASAQAEWSSWRAPFYGPKPFQR